MADDKTFRSAPVSSPRFAGSSANYLVRHLIGVTVALRRSFREELESQGHELSTAMSELVVNLPIDGLGMSDLAARLRLTLQRTGQVVASLEESGYVERITDENDGRAKRVAFTRRGRTLLEHIDATDASLTKGIGSVLGERRFARLCKDLEELDQAINGPDDVLNL